MSIPDNLDLLGTTRQTNVPLFATLIAVREQMKRRFGLDVCPLVTTDDVKGTIKSNRNQMSLSYPFGYWRINTITMNKERQNVKTARRHGLMRLGSSPNNADNTNYNLAFFFPARIEATFNYESNDIKQQLSFMERWLIMVATESLSVKVLLNIGEGLEWMVRIYSDDASVQLPETQIDAEESPSVFLNQLSFSIDTYIGTSKAVPKFNNEGDIQLDLDVGGLGAEQ
jgi:hypothetical protein